MAKQGQRAREVFAERVRDVREARPGKLSQAALARRMLELQGMSPENDKVLETERVKVARTEAGKRMPSVDDLFLFAAALGVPPVALLLPPEPEMYGSAVKLTENVSLPVPLVARWIVGQIPLRPEDAESYLYAASALPPRLTANEAIEVVEHLDSMSDDARDALRALVEYEKLRKRESEASLRYIEALPETDAMTEEKKQEARRAIRGVIETLERAITSLTEALDEKEEAQSKQPKQTRRKR
jgi:transcriptional regulator with XRE-family HTH domain